MAITLKRQESKEKQRQILAMLLTFLIGLGTFITLYLIKISFFDYPPADFEYGMAVSYGTDETGSGDQAVPIQEIITDNTNNNSENQNNQADNSSDVETSPISETRTNTNTTQTNNTTNKPKTEQKETTPPKKVTTTDNTPKKDGQGNDANQQGNKGKETGINQQGLYTGSGGSGGSSLSLSGWRWEKEPVVSDNSNVEGTIIFDVLVDEEGFFMSVKPRYPGTTVADQGVVERYRQAVLKAYLVPDGSRPATTSRGIVTYILKSR